MVLTDLSKEMLLDVFNHLKNTGNRELYIHVDRDEVDPIDISKMYNALDLLEEYDLAELTVNASGFFAYKITADGINIVENNFKHSSVDCITGDMYYIEHGNVYKNCYNNISVDVQVSELPKEVKELITKFLSDIQLLTDKPAKESRIKSFLRDVSSNTLSNSASSALSFLLSSIFNQSMF